MHALNSKSHYYDAMKTTQEDTILESDSFVENFESRLAPTFEVGCYARVHMKSNAVQTDFTRSNKNFRNEYTATSHELSASTLDCPFIRGEYSLHSSCSSPFAGSPHNQQYPFLNSRKTSEIAENVPICIDCFQRKKLLALESTPKLLKICNDKSTQCECFKCKKINCHCDVYIPCNRGLAAFRYFTLGTIESRRWQNEHCNSKLIGGCRVPVSKDCKSGF